MSEPTLAQKIKSVSYSALEWAKAGFAVVTEEDFYKRREICLSCPFFDSTAYFGDGKCTKCGCDMKIKTRMATESCPIGNWKSVNNFKP